MPDVQEYPYLCNNEKDIVFFPILKQFSSMSLQQKSASDINRGTTGKNNEFLAKKIRYFTNP